MSVHKEREGVVEGLQAHCSHGYDRSDVSNLAFYMDLV